MLKLPVRYEGAAVPQRQGLDCRHIAQLVTGPLPQLQAPFALKQRIWGKNVHANQQIWAFLGPSTAVETTPQREGETTFHLLSNYKRAAEESKHKRRKIQVYIVLSPNVDMLVSLRVHKHP